MKYQLTTIKDIFDKVPIDRIKTCMDELAVAMLHGKAMEKLLEFGMFEISGQKVEGTFQWPETSVWVDDGERTVYIEYKDQDGVHLFDQHVQIAVEE